MTEDHEPRLFADDAAVRHVGEGLIARTLTRTDAALPLAAKVNALLLAPEGGRDWPLRFYSPERLSSREARLGFVEPDLAERRASD